ncbi:DUF1310 family protein [Granulicatella adiacens]
MKKVLKWIAILLGIGIIAGCMNKPSKEKMNEELKKPEVVAVIEESIKNMDNAAFTEKGVVHSYAIDYDRTEYNPMGGINTTIIVNDNPDLYIIYVVKKKNQGYTVGGGVVSGALNKRVEENK